MRRYIFSTLMSLVVASSCLAVCAEDEKKDDAAPAATPAAATDATPAKAADAPKAKKEKKAKPVKAEKAETKADKPEKKAEKPEKKDKTASSGDGGGGVGGIASHIASFVAGTFVGIPVQIVRKSKVESIQATRDLTGETDKKWLTGMAAVLGVPAGILSGTMQGVVYGPLNAYRGTKDEPFSPETFSLGDSK